MQAAAPLRTGLSAARVVVWAAALALCAARARAGCFAAAAALVAAAQRVSQRSGVQRAAALMRQVTEHAMWLMHQVQDNTQTAAKAVGAGAWWRTLQSFTE